VVSSDECTKTKKNFDAELKAAIKAAAARVTANGNGHAKGLGYAVVGYDKNVPQASGLAKLLKVLRPLAMGTDQGLARAVGAVDLRVALVVPEFLDRAACWQRIQARGPSYLLNDAGGMAPGACSSQRLAWR